MKLWKASSGCDGFSDMRFCTFGCYRRFDFARISSRICDSCRNCRRYAFAFGKSCFLEKHYGFHYIHCGAHGLFRLFHGHFEIYGNWYIGADHGRRLQGQRCGNVGFQGGICRKNYHFITLRSAFTNADVVD